VDETGGVAEGAEKELSDDLRADKRIMLGSAKDQNHGLVDSVQTGGSTRQTSFRRSSLLTAMMAAGARRPCRVAAPAGQSNSGSGGCFLRGSSAPDLRGRDDFPSRSSGRHPQVHSLPRGRTLKLSLASKSARFQRLGGAAEHAKGPGSGQGPSDQSMDDPLLFLLCLAVFCLA
jgi:hypothetical protein